MSHPPASLLRISLIPPALPGFVPRFEGVDDREIEGRGGIHDPQYNLFRSPARGDDFFKQALVEMRHNIRAFCGTSFSLFL